MKKYLTQKMILVKCVLALSLLTLSICVWANDSFVGVRNDEYTVVEAYLPVSRNLPVALDAFLANALFDIEAPSVKEAFKEYKNTYDKILPYTRQNIKKAGKNKQRYKLTWLTYSDNRYASIVVRVSKVNKRGEKFLNKDFGVLYDLKENKRLKKEDVLSLTTLTEIDQLGGTSNHQLYVKEHGSLILQFMHKGQLKEVVFTTAENRNAFSPYFLSLMDGTASNKDDYSDDSSEDDADMEVAANAKEKKMGYMLYRNKDYKNAIPYLLKEAKAGYMYSQFALGLLYMEGKHIEKDDVKGYEWLSKAAQHNYAPAHYRLGHWYESGENYEKAADSFRKAANAGYYWAQNSLGLLYKKGQGVQRDYAQAMEWYKKAAAKNYPPAINNIGVLYEYGFGVGKDVDKAYEYYQRAHELDPNNKFSQKKLAQRDGKKTENMSKAEKTLPGKQLFVVVIGNEKYDDEADVPFAENDAKAFKDYCTNTLNVNEQHIRYVQNAGFNDIRKALSWLRKGLDAYGGEGCAVFYYAGHGIADNVQKSGYLLPSDGIGSDIATAYPLENLFKSLGSLPAKSVVVFLDACFSGTRRDGSVLDSARGVAIKSRQQTPEGNMIVFTAAQGDETAYPYKAQQHGMFTYYLLEKLKDSHGNITLGDLASYVIREVKRQSFDENNKSQTPTVTVSPSMRDSWKNIIMR